MHAHVQRLVTVVKMATTHEECTTKKQNSVVHFLWPNGLNAKDIHKKCFLFMVVTVSRKAVHNLVEKFPQRHSKVSDDGRPSCPVEITTEATVQRVKEQTQADRRITTDSVATALWCSHGIAYSLTHDRLKFWEVCTQGLPRELKGQEKMNQMGLS
jgi:hypothetical protein